jgi:hypothetical protein
MANSAFRQPHSGFSAALALDGTHGSTVNSFENIVLIYQNKEMMLLWVFVLIRTLQENDDADDANASLPDRKCVAWAQYSRACSSELPHDTSLLRPCH